MLLSSVFQKMDVARPFDMDGSTDLHRWARENESDSMEQYIKSVKDTQRLLDDLFTQDLYGNTPVHDAIRSDNDSLDWMKLALQLIDDFRLLIADCDQTEGTEGHKPGLLQMPNRRD